MELLRIMRSVLGGNAAAPDEDLSQLRLTPAQASALEIQMRARLGVGLAADEMLRLGTVARTAKALDERVCGPQEASHVTELRKGRGRSALYCLHPVDGSCFWYCAMADDLRSDVSAWSIGSHGMYHDGPLDSSVGAMAARYLDDIRGLHPGGPYHLLGWSMGGLVAWEMAYLLEQSGEVAQPILVDTANPAVLGTSGVSTIPVERMMEHMRLAELAAPWMDEAALRRRADVCITNAAASERFVPRPLGGVPILFRSVYGYLNAGFRHPDLGWLPYCGTGLEIRFLRSSHFALMNTADGRELLRAELDDLLPA
jgi:thioesterase domain-containing protein